MTTIVFACVHNAGRSQIAAAWFNQLVGDPGVHAVSAGTQPSERVHPEVAAAMAEVGIDLSSATPRRLTPELAAGAAMLITMGCGEDCPIVPGALRDDWPVADPKGQPPQVVQAIRDDIRARVEALVRRAPWANRG